jgi:FtsZ-binding cell division protein ZapB
LVGSEVDLTQVFGMSLEELKEKIRNVDIQKEKQDLMDNYIKDLRKENAELKKSASALDKTIKAQNFENTSKLQKIEESVDSLKSKFDDRENEDVEEVDDEEEPGIALEDQLRITEQSAKAIDLLSNHLLSTVWEPCSKNTFGKHYFVMISLPLLNIFS